MTIVGRAVPWLLPVENREKAREGIYYSVCLHLTHYGDRLKKLDGHEEKPRSAEGFIFILYFKGSALVELFFMK